MEANLGTSKTATATARKRRRRRTAADKRNRRRKVWSWTAGTVLSLLFLAGVAVIIGFGTPWGRQFRMSLAETVISTRHAYLAKVITTPVEYARLESQLYNPKVVNTGVPHGLVSVHPDIQNGPVEFKRISGPGWNGWAMFVHDPRLIRLVKANVEGGMGEYITKMAPRVGAIAGVNASGFEDPNGNGWGGVPVGLEFVGGQVINDLRYASTWTSVGFTQDGIMVMGNYTLGELQNLGVRDAMQFHPELVANGQPMITSGDGGWGYGPRTAIGQAKDGTVIFIVINGRFKNGSVGASQKQVMDLMLQYGAVNACAMDGGSSSVLYDAAASHPILNSPSTIDPNGERHLPDAWLVFSTEAAANRYTP